MSLAGRILAGSVMIILLLVVVAGILAYANLIGSQRLPFPIMILNDTDAEVTILIEHGGEEYQPEHDDIFPRLNPGESGQYGLDSEYASLEPPRVCTDGDIIARYDDGSEVRIAPPICDNELVRIAEWATAVYVTNDTPRTYEVWVEHGGELVVPGGDDQHVETGSTARFTISVSYAESSDEGPICIDGEVIARHVNTPDIRIRGPICDGDSFALSDFSEP